MVADLFVLINLCVINLSLSFDNDENLEFVFDETKWDVNFYGWKINEKRKTKNESYSIWIEYWFISHSFLRESRTILGEKITMEKKFRRNYFEIVRAQIFLLLNFGIRLTRKKKINSFHTLN